MKHFENFHFVFDDGLRHILEIRASYDVCKKAKTSSAVKMCQTVADAAFTAGVKLCNCYKCSLCTKVMIHF